MKNKTEQKFNLPRVNSDVNNLYKYMSIDNWPVHFGAVSPISQNSETENEEDNSGTWKVVEKYYAVLFKMQHEKIVDYYVVDAFTKRETIVNTESDNWTYITNREMSIHDHLDDKNYIINEASESDTILEDRSITLRRVSIHENLDDDVCIPITKQSMHGDSKSDNLFKIRRKLSEYHFDARFQVKIALLNSDEFEEFSVRPYFKLFEERDSDPLLRLIYTKLAKESEVAALWQAVLCELDGNHFHNVNFNTHNEKRPVQPNQQRQDTDFIRSCNFELLNIEHNNPPLNILQEYFSDYVNKLTDLARDSRSTQDWETTATLQALVNQLSNATTYLDGFLTHHPIKKADIVTKKAAYGYLKSICEASIIAAKNSLQDISFGTFASSVLRQNKKYLETLLAHIGSAFGLFENHYDSGQIKRSVIGTNSLFAQSTSAFEKRATSITLAPLNNGF